MKNTKTIVHWLILTMTILLIGAIPARVFGQTANSASLNGKVTDGKGAPLPGVSISVTGPQLQVAELTSTSDEAGNYQVLNLPAPGVYTITVTLQGFEKFVRSGINLGVGFAGRVDIPMKIGEVSQTVEVQGGSPVIDTQSAGTTSALDEEAIQSAPKGMTMQEMLPMAKGVSMTGPPDVGDSNLAARNPVITYGVVLVPTLNYETINMSTDKAADTAVYLDAYAIQEAEFKAVGNNADVAYPGVLQEAVMKSGSNTYHGHVRGNYENPSFQSSNTTSTTLSSPLVNTGYYDYSADVGGRVIRDKLWGYGGYSFQGIDQGQPFFVAAPGDPTAAGCNYANYWLLNDTCKTAKPGDVINSLREYDFKFSYQMKPRVKFLGSFAHGAKFLSDNGFSPTVAQEAGQYQHQPTHLWHVETQIPFSPRFLLDAGFGNTGYRAIYTTMPASQIGKFGYTNGSDFAGSPSQEELITKSFTGPYVFPQNKPQYRYEMKIFASFIPSGSHLGGTHQFKFGTVEDWEKAGDSILADKPSGDYTLIFQNKAVSNPITAGCTPAQVASPTNIGVPTGCPYQLLLYNYPFPNSINNLVSYSGYITEQYTHKRLTLNVGVRGETYNATYPTQAKTPGQFSVLFPAVTYPGQNILRWTDVVPRAGLALDVFGNGKTVLKGSFGMFGDTMGDQFATTFNPNAQQVYTFNWDARTTASGGTGGACVPTAGSTTTSQAPAKTTPVQYNCDVTPAFLQSLASSEVAAQASTPAGQTLKHNAYYVSNSGGASQVLNPGLKQDTTYAYAASLERQVVPNVSVSASYIHYHIYNLYNSATGSAPANSNPSYNGNGTNVGHPLSSYTKPYTYTDTFKGVSTVKTAYGYCTQALVLAGDPSCPSTSNLGNSTNEVLNNPSNRPDVYNSFEVAATKRYSKRWNASTSFWATKSHRWINGQAGVAGSPNDNNTPNGESFTPTDNTFALDTTWHWEARADVTYNLPKGFQVLTFYRAASGTKAQRTDAVTTTAGSTTIVQEPFGAESGPVVSVWNIKGAKQFKFKEHYMAEANFQVYNILNTNAAVTTTYNSTTGQNTFGTPSVIVAPRVFRVGGVFSF